MLCSHYWLSKDGTIHAHVLPYTLTSYPGTWDKALFVNYPLNISFLLEDSQICKTQYTMDCSSLKLSFCFWIFYASKCSPLSFRQWGNSPCVLSFLFFFLNLLPIIRNEVLSIPYPKLHLFSPHNSQLFRLSFSLISLLIGLSTFNLDSWEFMLLSSANIVFGKIVILISF